MRIATVVVSILAALAAAQDSDREAPPSTAATPPEPSTVDASTSAPDSTATVTPVRRAFDDVLSWLNSPETVDADRFSAEFLDDVPIDELIAVFEDLSNAWLIESIDEPAENQLTAIIREPMLLLEVQLSVDGEGRISALWFAPALEDPPETLDQVAEQVDGFGPTSAFLAAEVDGTGVCQPLAAVRADLALPVGSVFKLYVLGAVATAIDEGTLTWDQPVVIRDELDSLPSGITQDEPAGSTLTVEELARRMIAISDNTATDHLIDLVGRDRVEAALTSFGHSEPAITLPFLTTRELFALRSNFQLRMRYLDADENARRQLLAEEITGQPVHLLDWYQPRDVTTVEWFATPTDICQALVALDDLDDDPDLAPVRGIMTANEDLFTTDQELARLLYKAGGEPGVHFEAWLAATVNGQRFAIVGGAASDIQPIHPTLSTLLATALDLVPE
jgi:Beta-lactamase enzyme family/ORF 12 gene product N-terminal